MFFLLGRSRQCYHKCHLRHHHQGKRSGQVCRPSRLQVLFRRCESDICRLISDSRPIAAPGGFLLGTARCVARALVAYTTPAPCFHHTCRLFVAQVAYMTPAACLSRLPPASTTPAACLSHLLCACPLQLRRGPGFCAGPHPRGHRGGLAVKLLRVAREVQETAQVCRPAGGQAAEQGGRGWPPIGSEDVRASA